MQTPSAPGAQPRLHAIHAARQAVLFEGRPLPDTRTPAWIERSWRRCLQQGHDPRRRVDFNLVPDAQARRVRDAGQALVAAARPTLERLGPAIAGTRYFAVLTDAQGIVLDVHGAPGPGDRRARVLTRIGTDLSEASIGTSAIGAALAELQPVWLHRGEHFFDDNAAYSCAGAPVSGPDGRCVGMLDLTGIDTPERPELMHLAAQSARSIENALVLAQPHALRVRLNWPGRLAGDDADGLLCLDAEGWVVGGNTTARQIVSGLARPATRAHCSELFALPWEILFDRARSTAGAAPLAMPLWSGLRVHALPSVPDGHAPSVATAPLRDIEAALIHQAVEDAHGNVQQAARALGISRATVYRKLGRLGRKNQKTLSNR